MGKTSKTSSPDYSKQLSGTVKINGVTVSTSKDGVTNYNLTPAQKAAYNYAQTAFSDGLSSINTFLPETINNLYEQVTAYKNQGINTINEVYEPMLKNLQTDVSKRFGNLDNSIFLDDLKDIEGQRANAVNLLAQDVTAKQNELVNDELTNRYNLLSFLNNYQNQVFGNALSASNSANNNAQSYANYQNALVTLANNQNKTSSSNSALTRENLLKALGYIAFL